MFHDFCTAVNCTRLVGLCRIKKQKEIIQSAWQTREKTWITTEALPGMRVNTWFNSTKGTFFQRIRECTFGGVYVPCIYSHARWKVFAVCVPGMISSGILLYNVSESHQGEEAGPLGTGQRCLGHRQRTKNSTWQQEMICCQPWGLHLILSHTQGTSCLHLCSCCRGLKWNISDVGSRCYHQFCSDEISSPRNLASCVCSKTLVCSADLL